MESNNAAAAESTGVNTLASELDGASALRANGRLGQFELEVSCDDACRDKRVALFRLLRTLLIRMNGVTHQMQSLVTTLRNTQCAEINYYETLPSLIQNFNTLSNTFKTGWSSYEKLMNELDAAPPHFTFCSRLRLT